MLKFITTDSENKNSISSILKDIGDIEEFLTKKTAEEIQNYLIEQSEKSTRKEKNTIAFVNKVISMFFFEHKNRTNYSFGEITKDLIDKFITISQNLNNINEQHVGNFANFYLILADNHKGRFHMILKFFKFLNQYSHENDFLKKINFKFEMIEDVVVDFIKYEKNYERGEMTCFYEVFCQFIVKNKLFYNLQKRIISSKQHSNYTIFESIFNYFNGNYTEIFPNICYVIFFYIFCTSSAEKSNVFYFDLKTYNEILPKFKRKFNNETGLINTILENNLTFIKNCNFEVFNEFYGKKEAEQIQKNAYLRVISNVIHKLNPNEPDSTSNLIVIPFEAMEKEFNLKIEEIEEILFDANDAGLYKLKIDYINKQLKFSHLRTKSPTKEDVLKLKNKISLLREKLNSFIHRIDLVNN